MRAPSIRNRVLFVVFLALAGLTACGASVVGGATSAANVAREVELTAGKVLRERCTELYRKVAAAQVPSVDELCLPARRAYGLLRSARLALVAAVLSYHARGNAAELLGAVGRAAVAGEELGRAVARLPGE